MRSNGWSLVGCVALVLVGSLAQVDVAWSQDGRGERGWVKPDQKAERRVALVIGNSRYRDSPLRNPGNDAHAMAKALREVGFDVIEKLDLDQKGMKIAIRDFGEKLGNGGGVGLFYYAGHAMQVNGHNYLIPVDANIQKESDVDIESVLVDAVLDQMGGSESRLNVVVLDACRNNPFARSFRSASQGLAFMNAPRGTLIAYATAPGSVAADGDGDNGTYTAALVKRLNTEGLEIGHVFRKVREDVLASSSGRQVPWESSSLVGEFYFKGAVTPAPTPVVTPKPEPQVVTPPQPQVVTPPEPPPVGNDAKALFADGINKYKQGNFQGAIQAWSTIIRDYPMDPSIDRVYLNIGSAYEKLGETSKAQAAYKKVVSGWPSSRSAEQAMQRLSALSSSEAPPANTPVKVTSTEVRITERVYFAHGKAVIKPAASPILDAVAYVLNSNPDLNLRVTGHTDSEGSDKANLKLSEDRAKAVVKYLTGKGISASRLSAVGYGETRPINMNTTAAGRAMNNRVEFEVVTP